MNDEILKKISELPFSIRIGAFFQILFFIGAAIAFSIISGIENTPGYNVKVDNFESTLSTIKEEGADISVGNALYKAIKENQPNSTIQLHGHNVRKDSITESFDSEKNYTITSFIIDTNGNGSYKVDYRWSEDPTNIYLIDDPHAIIEKID